MEQQSLLRTKFGISGSTLKLIAIFTMLIDHIGAAIIEPNILAFSSLNTIMADPVKSQLLIVNGIFRTIGRISFPIFCFLLIEGFQHTKDRKKYALRLFIFCLISEIPFDLAFHHKMFDFGYQNVFFTLFIGLLVLIGIEQFKKNILLQITSIAAGLFLALFMKTDYSFFGVFFIVLLYFYKDRAVWQTILGSLALIWEITAPLAFIPIRLYNGQRGLQLKYVFYLFYPVHLILLYLIGRFIVTPMFY